MEKLLKRIYEFFEENNHNLVDAGLQPIRTIDRYRGQTINPEGFEIYEIPALFIGWRTTWVQEGKTYKGNVQLDAHLVTDEPWGTDNKSTNYDEALKAAFLHTAVQKMLDGLSSEVTTPLVRAADQPVDTGVICYTILGYNTTIYDTADNSDLLLIGENINVAITGKHLKRKLTDNA